MSRLSPFSRMDVATCIYVKNAKDGRNLTSRLVISRRLGLNDARGHDRLRVVTSCHIISSLDAIYVDGH